ncbi:MAG: electron transfer flavoprotein subunit alpha/FixB family protein [Chloroflexi bacterium]|mgnify:FL=1|jgi:electron transfer flavoprotein alpha subunit|nr:electron transfer flavoprotein subunit alpha/FixB family protein [Chloroflexota bacterium]MBT5252415.1 electron transfer flavoprotein subunit alpha/FixB family protein [Chloroflexota bacterium]MBT6707669.1 electron transfer flavoprotein subunit alpha/FixB family protein [Chloroflexota bacterium]MBT7004542.1 electron transfer flavoprotein subunit alpha/FixB family protein [Chloroflexota bacterium]MBT7079663.1 electron transfer flavoprotein subunit alpha/FixB family protein [Chloroflexota bact
MTSILVVAECDEQGEISQSTLQAIVAAKGLVDPVVTVVIAGEAPASASTLAVGKIVTLSSVDDADAGIYDQATAVISSLVESTSPEIVIFSKSDFGSVVGARMAFRSDSAFASDCIEISNAGDGVSVTRPVYGGSALAEFEIPTRPAIITLRAGVYEAGTETGLPLIEAFESDVNVERVVSVTGTVAEAREGVRLEDANFVVSGGRGLGGPEPFSVLADLANALGGAVGASRAACDAGWIDHSHQVGLTGKSVSPDVYIAIGISGASQHMAGCSSSRAIVAINKDGDSNIFKEARFGIVGDWEKALPSFLATVRELKA